MDSVAPRLDNGHFADCYENRSEIIADICLQLAQGVPLTVACRGENYPDPSTVWRWSEADPQTAQAIARARLVGHDAIADSLLAIADDKSGDPQRDKLRVDTRLKLLAKWDPKRYGDSTQLRHADANGDKIDTTPLVGELLNLMGGKAPVIIEAKARDVTPARTTARDVTPAKPQPLIDSGSTTQRRPVYRPRGRSGVDDLV